MPHRATGVSVLLIGLGSCKTPEPSSWVEDPACVDAPTWEGFAQGWLRTQCTSCHGSSLEPAQRQGAPEDVNFDTYASTVSYGPAILAWAVGETPPMPPAGSTTPDTQEQLTQWVQCGWPRDGLSPFDRCAEPGQPVLASDVNDALCNDAQAGLVIQGDLLDTTAHACICEVQGDLNLGVPSQWPVLHTVTGSLTAREGFISPVLEHVEGTLDIAGVTDESLSFPALTRVGGDLTLRDVWVDRIQWPVLHSVGGHLDIQDCGADTIESPHLQDVGGDLTLATSRFEALTGFDSLRTVGGSLSLHSLDGFETIEGFSQLASVESILIEACPNLMGIDAFGAIERLNGALSLSELPALHYVGGWSSLTAIDGAFTVRGTALASLDPWPPVVTTGSFSLEDQPLLSSLKEFDSLTHVFHNLLIRNTPQLEPEHIEQWLKAIEVNGSISIE